VCCWQFSNGGVGRAGRPGRGVTAPMLFATDSVAVRPAETASPSYQRRTFQPRRLSYQDRCFRRCCVTTVRPRGRLSALRNAYGEGRQENRRVTQSYSERVGRSPRGRRIRNRAYSSPLNQMRLARGASPTMRTVTLATTRALCEIGGYVFLCGPLRSMCQRPQAKNVAHSFRQI